MYFEAPDYGFLSFKNEKSLFLAGGISDCSDWQSEIYSKLDFDGIILNPRRVNFPMTNSKAAAEQIEWEYDALEWASTILFWFEADKIQPISLFELGRWSHTDLTKRLIVGCHPDYPRIADVKIQLALSRPEIEVQNNLNAMVQTIKKHFAP